MSLPWATTTNPCMSWGECGQVASDVGCLPAGVLRSQDTAELGPLTAALACRSGGAGDFTDLDDDDDDDDDDEWMHTKTGTNGTNDTDDDEDVAIASATDLIRRYNPKRNTALRILQEAAEADKNSVLDRTTTTANNKRNSLRIVDSGVCPPYKIEYFERELFEHDPGDARRRAVIQTLRIMGVKVYVIEQLSIKNTHDLVKQIQSVVKWTREESHNYQHQHYSSNSRSGGGVAREADNNSELLGPQRCLLYEDLNGRLFNLVFDASMQGPATQWREYRDAFSTSRAIAALVVLVRSMPCLLYRETFENVRPLYFLILIGLVLREETSFTEINASLLVRCTPSISSHMLDCTFRSDVPRHVVLLALALAPATTDLLHTVLTTIGVVGTCWLLLVNIGARTWHFLRLRGIRYEGCGQVRVAAYSAWATGFCLPYLSHRSTTMGGKQSVEHVIGSAICVAFCMLVSDFSFFTQYLVIGSEPRHQDVVNILLGCWWLVSLLCSLLLVRKPGNAANEVPDGEHLLVKDDLAPLGCKVPSLPDFEVDPLQSLQPQQQHWECILSIIVALLIGSAWALISFSDWGRDVYYQLLQGN